MQSNHEKIRSQIGPLFKATLMTTHEEPYMFRYYHEGKFPNSQQRLCRMVSVLYELISCS